MKRRTILVGGGVAAAAALVAGVAVFRSTNTADRRDGAALLAVELPDVDGHDQSLSQWRGKVLVVNFWATWCAPCREEMPQFVAVQAALIGGFGAIELSKSLGNSLSALPFTVVIDRGGRVVERHLGPLVQPQLDRVLDQLLKPA
jgi:thiol-disulfide isomerase/thioredoxin